MKLSIRRIEVLVAAALLPCVLLMAPTSSTAYQAGGNVSMSVQTGYSGLTTTISKTDGDVYIEPSSTMNSGRDWSVDFTTYTPDIRAQRGLQWYTSGSNCSYPGSGASTSGCNKGNITFTFSRPVKDPVFHIHDFGGRMEANCKLAIQGTLTLSSTTPAGGSLTKLSGGITVSGSAISGRNTSTAPFVESNHSSGSVRINGTVKVITFAETVLLSRQGATCSYGSGDMLMSAVERLNATFSYSEDLGDGAASYDGASAASHIIGDLKIGSNTVSAEAAATLNSSTSAIASSPIASAAANSDNDDAISGTLTPATIDRDYSVVVPISGASQAGQVCGFIDMNSNGVYSTSSPNEGTCTSFASGASSATLTWMAAQWPAGASAVASTGLRLRAAYGSGGSSPTGPVDSGEVEDYLVQLLSPVPPDAVELTGTATQDANQTVTPATSQGSMDASRTCIVSGSSCLSTLEVSGEGTYTVNGDGTITFNPLPAFTGDATPVAYRIEDASGQQSTSTISLVVVPPPTSTNDSTTTPYNTAVTTNVLTNDSADSRTSLSASTLKLCGSGETAPNCTASSVVVAGKGTFTRDAATGEVTFTPLATFTGSATIDYKVSDALGGVASATYSVSVGVPSAPSATPTESSGPLDTNQSITLNGSPGGAALDPLQTCIVSGASCVRSLNVPGEGVYTVNADGTVTFDPAPTFTGEVSYTYRVYDVVGQPAEATLTVTVAAAPTAVSNTSSGLFDVDQVVNVLSNDAAGDGATLNASSVKICVLATSDASCSSTSLTIPGEGTYTVNDNGTITFDPLPTFAGDATAIKYVVSDNFGQKSSAQISVEVEYPEPSDADPNTSEGISGATQTVNPLDNDTSAAGVSLDATTVRLCGDGETVPNCTATSVYKAGQGTYSVNTTTGIVTFVPDTGFAGTAGTVSYVVEDSLSRVISSTITASVVGPPTIVDDTSSGDYNTNQTIEVLDNDSADSPATLDPSSVRICTASTSDASCSSTTLTIPGEGTYTVNSNGTITFDPLPTFAGDATAIKYVVSDNFGQKSSAQISVEVEYPEPSDADPNTSEGISGATQTVNPLDNDTSAAGVSLDATTVRLCGDGETVPNCTATSVYKAGQGTYSVNTTTGIVTFVPDTGFAGTAGTVSYVVEDSLSRVISSTITASVVGPPTIVDDTSSGDYNTNQTIEVLDNDSADSPATLDPSSVRICTTVTSDASCSSTSLTIPGEGTYTVNDNGTITFDPLPTFSGTATPIKYVVDDSAGQSDSGNIVISVDEPPAPTADPEVKPLLPGQSTTFSSVTTVLGDGAGIVTGGGAGGPCLVDPNDMVCKTGFTIVGEGTWSIDQATGEAIFASDPDAIPGDQTPVIYMITDAVGQTATSTLTPVVVGPPVANPDTKTTSWNKPTSISVLGNDDHDAEVAWDLSSMFLCGLNPQEIPPNCTKKSLTVSGEGTYTVKSDGTVSFRPERTFFGVTQTITYQVEDDLGQLVHATLKVTVNEPPLADPGSETIEVAPSSTGEFSEIEGGGLIIFPKNGPALDPSTLCIVHPRTGECGTDPVVIPGFGTYFIDPETGQIKFRAFSNAPVGEVPEIEYRINDEVGRTISGSVSAVVVSDDSDQLPPTGGNSMMPLIAGFGLLVIGSFVRILRRA